MMKIISGGQTGADRGALDFAIAAGISHGGWCPRGRKAEDGRIPDKYLLKEHSSSEYPPRTLNNVLEAQGTAIFIKAGQDSRGTQLTIRYCQSSKKPYIILDNYPDILSNSTNLREWMEQNHITVLNVAGPRESRLYGIGDHVYATLAAAFNIKIKPL